MTTVLLALPEYLHHRPGTNGELFQNVRHIGFPAFKAKGRVLACTGLERARRLSLRVGDGLRPVAHLSRGKRYFFFLTALFRGR